MKAVLKYATTIKEQFLRIIAKLSKNFVENITTELARNLMYESLFNANLLN